MSFDTEDLRGMFTELEIASGIASFIDGTDDREAEAPSNQEKEHLERIDKEKKNRELNAIEMSEKCKTLESLKTLMIKRIINEEIEYIIKRYSLKEELPAIYHQLILKDECIEVLVKGMLSRFAKIKINADLDIKIKKLASSVLQNDSLDSPYTRVGRIQEFIHYTVDANNGRFSCAKLPKLHMKNLLSAARLNLSIKDISEGGILYIKTIMDTCYYESKNEIDNNEPDVSLRLALSSVCKNYYPKWKVRHLKHISYYSRETSREIIESIQNIDDDIFFEEENRKELITLYCSLIR